jgi:hypothetical protein
MIVVAVCDQDGREIKPVLLQIIKHGCCISRINDNGVRIVVGYPDVIVISAG